MKRVLKLEGLDCADCAAKLERAISKLEGVNKVGINFITLKCSLESDNIEEVLPKVIELIKKEHPDIEVERV